MVEGSLVVDRSSNVGGSGGAGGDDIGSSRTPPRDPAKGKGVAAKEEHVEEEQTTEAATVEIRVENIAFGPPVTVATSSRHVPITLDDVAKHTPDEILAKLLEDHPIIEEYVLKAKEDRARAIEAFEAAARAERERAGPKGLVEDMEAEEREAEEEQGPRVRAVDEAGAMTRPEFSEETYMLPRPHLFVLSGFAWYKPPQQTDYDVELVLRDPRVHIANTWAEVEHRDIHGFGGPCSSLALEVERYHQHFPPPPGEMTVAPTDFAAITGLRVQRDPIPFDSGIYKDPAALEWFLGEVPKVERGAARGSTVHLSYLPALRDLRRASLFDWGGAALGTAYLFLGDSSRMEQSAAGYWRIWEVWFQYSTT
ncbi:hypothetical protein RHMOL_Rhmol04G0151500 [Rhododendron molle]|uniref:Uncharacterized protein n=1 Tax=Rhododendron molle TaxID=49168 RepID=A0ACC0P1V4_RHOML|nr:hypothetical protein RHMOL_Rhmol04G0151500 [Rhododendron molle]